MVAGRREPEWLRPGRDCPPFRRQQVEGACGAVACGRHVDLDLSFGPRGEEPHVGQGPEDDGGDHFQWASRLPLLCGLNGGVADLESLVANLESVRDGESRRRLGSPDQAGQIDREEADAVVIDQPVRVVERSLGRQGLVQIARCGPSGARSIGWSSRSPVVG